MKKRYFVKSISIILAMASLICILSSCSSSTNEIKFRDISFGTKYSVVMSKIKKDLNSQGYNEEPIIEQFPKKNEVDVRFNKIKLYDYDDVDLILTFLKEDNEDLDDAKLIYTDYILRFSNKGKDKKELAKEAYDYLDKKFTELYGEKTELKLLDYKLSAYDAQGWKKGNTFCSIDEGNINSGVLSIYYGFLDDMQQFANSIIAEEENK